LLAFNYLRYGIIFGSVKGGVPVLAMMKARPWQLGRLASSGSSGPGPLRKAGMQVSVSGISLHLAATL